MAVRLREALGSALDQLRYEPTAKRVRAELGGTVVADSERAVLVWEPRRLVPTYAVPEADLHGELTAAPSPGHGDRDSGFSVPELSARRLLDPRVPFAVRDTPGEQ